MLFPEYFILLDVFDYVHIVPRYRFADEKKSATRISAYNNLYNLWEEIIVQVFAETNIISRENTIDRLMQFYSDIICDRGHSDVSDRGSDLSLSQTK